MSLKILYFLALLALLLFSLMAAAISMIAGLLPFPAMLCELVAERSSPISRDLVLGLEQTPYRGECMAILAALQHVYHCCIHADCSAALWGLDALLRARADCNPYPFRGHDDIWQRAWWHLLQRPVGTVSWQKVRAHVAWHQCVDPQLKLWGRVNEQVDKDAKRAVVEAPDGLFNKLQRRFNDFQRIVEDNASLKGSSAFGADCSGCLLLSPS